MKYILKLTSIIITAISLSYGLAFGQAVTNIPCNQLPAFTGDITKAAGSCATVAVRTSCPAVVNVFATGTNATYTTPTCSGLLPSYLEMEMVGGGGGGAGSGTTPPAATAGTATCWNTAGTACSTPVYSTGGGALGVANAAATSTGGAVTGSGTCDEAQAGGFGGAATNQGSSFGGMGGSSRYGGGGTPGFGGANSAGAATGPGSGGGGSGQNATANGGGGGASGAFCRKLITPVSATYTYTVGTAGAAGTAGTGGNAGAAGFTGQLRVTAKWF